MSYAINESCVIKSNSDYRIDPIKHHLKDAIVLNRENELTLRCGRNIDASLNSIDRALSPNLGFLGKEHQHPFKERDVGHELKRIVTRKLLNRRKRPTIDGWRLSDKEYGELIRVYIFTLEGYCDPLNLNGHRNLPFYSEQNFLLGHDVSGQSNYDSPPWSVAINCVEHLRACHSKSRLDTKAVNILPNWSKFKAVTKELKLIKQLPKGEKVFMRTTPTGTYDPPDIITFARVIN
jgi:hypothetical protein